MRIIEYVFQIIKRIFPFFRVFVGIIITFFASVFIFITSTLFFGFIGGGGVFDMAPTSSAVFQEILLIQDFSFVLSSAFLVAFIPLFLLLLCGFVLILNKRVIGLSVFLFLFITWMLSLSYLTTQVLKNTENIGNIAEIIGEDIHNEKNDHHIYLDI